MIINVLKNDPEPMFRKVIYILTYFGTYLHSFTQHRHSEIC